MAVKRLLKQILDGVLIFHCVTERLSAVKSKSFSLNLCRGNDWAFSRRQLETKTNKRNPAPFHITCALLGHRLRFTI